MQPIQAKIAELRQRLAGTPVTATEPVFGYMFAALGMQVRNMPFQMAVMNNTEPGASDVAAFENDLKTHQVRLLVYNSQASDPIAARMERLAKAVAHPGGGRDRNRAARQDLPGVDDERTRRHRPGVAGVAAMNAIELRDVRAGAGRPGLLDATSAWTSPHASSSACWDRTAPARPR